MVLPLIIPTRILDEANVIVALTLYTTALLVRAVPEALDAVPVNVRDAASAIGYSRIGQLLKVELPLAIPVLTAGLRVVAVTNISMVAVGSVIGIGGLGCGSPRATRPTRAIRSWRGSSRSSCWRSSSTSSSWPPDGSSPRGCERSRGGGRRHGFLQQALDYIFTADNWGGSAGLGARIVEHLQYTGIAVAVAAVIAVPHRPGDRTHRPGSFLVVSTVNALRAPAHPRGAAARRADVGPRSAAADGRAGTPGDPAVAGRNLCGNRQRRSQDDRRRAVDGDVERRVLTRVEVPNALPLILGGLRTATLQVVATATVAAYASLGGLGRYLIDGIKVRQFYLAWSAPCW